MRYNRRQVLSKSRTLAEHFGVDPVYIEDHTDRDNTTALYPDEFYVRLYSDVKIFVECVTRKVAMENELCNLNGNKKRLRSCMSKNAIGIYTRMLDERYYFRIL